MQNNKTMKKLLLILILSLWGLGGFAQTSTDTLLCRKWKVDWTATYALMSAENQAKFQALPTDQQQSIQSSMSSRVYTFRTDSTLNLQWQTQNNQPNQEMTWLRVNDTLTLTYNGNAKQIQIIQITSDRLVFGIIESAALFTKLHLKPTI